MYIYTRKYDKKKLTSASGSSGGLGLLGFAVAGFRGAGGFESGEQVGVFVFANL